MSKKRKTKKEKMRSIVRQNSHFTESSPVYSIETNSLPSQEITKDFSQKYSNTFHYAYVLRDARQTFLVTSCLFAMSLILYFLIQNHVLNLKFLGY